MKQVQCYVCNSSDTKVVVRQDFPDKYLELINPDYNQGIRSIVVCSRCGLVYRDPQIDEDDARKLYEHFRDHSVLTEPPDQYFDRISGLPDDQSENHAKLSWLTSHIGDFLGSQGNRVLDIGCGGGVFLAKFKEWYGGWDCFGVEPTPQFAELARRRAGLEVEQKMYHPGIFGGNFDLISVLQVFEHVLDPIKFMQGVSEDLTDDGFAFVESPHISDLPYLPADHDRFHAHHVYIHTRRTFEYVCAKAGLKLDYWSVDVTVRDKRNFSALVSRGTSELPTLPLDDPDEVMAMSAWWRQP